MMIRFIVASTTTINTSSPKIPPWATPPLVWSGKSVVSQSVSKCWSNKQLVLFAVTKYADTQLLTDP